MPVFQAVLNSCAAPFFSDTMERFIEADSPVDALKKAVEEYDHSSGLYAAIVQTCEPEPKMMARFLSARENARKEASDRSEGGVFGLDDKFVIREHGKEKFVYIKDFKPTAEFFDVNGKVWLTLVLESIKPFKPAPAPKR